MILWNYDKSTEVLTYCRFIKGVKYCVTVKIRSNDAADLAFWLKMYEKEPENSFKLLASVVKYCDT